VGDPARDLVLLNAPGQQEVWSYYDPGLPILALPAARPPDRAATETALADAVGAVRRVHALFWATDEADPEQIVESWLDRHAFKGLESWQGNLRYVTYTLPDEALSCMPLEPPVPFGDAMALEGWCLAEDAAVTAGDTALVTLQWRARRALDERFKVSVQLQDGARQVIAQHDSEPAGGSRPTSDWQPGEAVTDNHGLFVPPGTPPGPYRLFVTVYEPENGTRLPVTGGDALELGEVRVVLPVESPPLEIVDMKERVNQRLGPVTLVGYDQHKLGYAHAPDTSLAPGDPVEFVFYWQAPDPLPVDWPPAQTFTLTLGDQQLVSPLAGSTLPTLEWQADQLVRTIVQLPYDGSAANALLQVGDATLKLKRLPAEDAPE
jgi:mannosyltransferase